MRRKIVLIGMMGAGKSAVGAELARRLNVPLVDIDTEIERAATMTIPEIFARDGEAFFRSRESEVLARVMAGGPAVVSTGGGAWMRQQNRDAIAGKGVSVWLDGDLDTLWHRVRQRPGRPLLQTRDPKATLAALLQERNPVYALADLRIEARRRDTVSDSATRVQEALAAFSPETAKPDDVKPETPR